MANRKTARKRMQREAERRASDPGLALWLLSGVKPYAFNPIHGDSELQGTMDRADEKLQISRDGAKASEEMMKLVLNKYRITHPR